MQIIDYKKTLLFVWLFLIIFPEKIAFGSEENIVQLENFQLDNQLFLPLLIQSDQFTHFTTPIWFQSEVIQTFEVVLFRKTFSLEETASSSTFRIFADTRYEVYVDGVWIGRGPARFSHDRREYDVYSINNLNPGNHVIAVLVQWDPNYRRSESIAPMLQAYLQGEINGQIENIATTDTSWKAIKSIAWNSEAALVHSWGLIGHTELVDLNELPMGWYKNEYQDEIWPFAVPAQQVKDVFRFSVPVSGLNLGEGQLDLFLNVEPKFDQIPLPHYSARTIAPLTEIPIPLKLIDQGFLSPDHVVLELSGDELNQSIQFDALIPTIFSVEILSSTNVVPSANIELDGEPLYFSMSSTLRPGVKVASAPISMGIHVLTIQDIPPSGLTIGLLSKDILYQNLSPFNQGDHAGRRLLLAEPISSNQNLSNNDELDLNLNFEILPAYAVIDLGRTIHGRAKLQVNGPLGTVLDLGWDERLLPGTKRPLPFPGSLHPHMNQVDSWVLDGFTREVTTIDARAGRYLLLAVWGANGPVEVRLNVTEERYPVVQHGYFDSSDDLLDLIWQTGVESAYPNMTDAFTDTPWRERGQWWGDAFVVDRINRVAFGDFSLLKRGLLYMADGFDHGQPQAFVPNGFGAHMVDYGMLWVFDFQEYLQLTGDRAFARDLYPTLLAFMDYLEGKENPSTGLLDFPDENWATTIYIDTMAWMTRKGQSTPANAMYIETLLRAATIADQLGDGQKAAQLRNRAQQKTSQYNALLYLPDQECYLTSVFAGQAIPPSVYSQAWPLAYDLVLPQNVGSVFQCLQTLLSSDPENANVGTYGMYWVLASYFQNGYLSEAINLIKTYYGWMLSQGATTWWEHFQSGQNYRSSLSHAWGASPTWFLTTYILGVQQTAPGEWQIKPAFSGVENVSGAIPLADDGLLSVSWDTFACEIVLDTQSPPATSGKVIIPVEENTEISWNGQIIWATGDSFHEHVQLVGSEVHINVQGGDHHFEISAGCAMPSQNPTKILQDSTEK